MHNSLSNQRLHSILCEFTLECMIIRNHARDFCCPLSDLGQGAGKSHSGGQEHRKQGNTDCMALYSPLPVTINAFLPWGCFFINIEITVTLLSGHFVECWLFFLWKSSFTRLPNFPSNQWYYFVFLFFLYFINTPCTKMSRKVKPAKWSSSRLKFVFIDTQKVISSSNSNDIIPLSADQSLPAVQQTATSVPAGGEAGAEPSGPVGPGCPSGRRGSTGLSDAEYLQPVAHWTPQVISAAAGPT